MNRTLGWFILFLAAALPAAGSESQVNLPITLPGGITADLTVSFESVTGLTPDNLGVSAQVVSTGDPSLLARLPATASIPAGFPVLVRIEPPATGGLTFTGIVSIQIHTPPLPSTPNVPDPADTLRLVAAPLGGVFTDITTALRTLPQINMDTSYRVIGTKAGFSEFLIISDQMPPDQAAAAKLDRLDQILADNAGTMPGAVRSSLAAELAAARAHSLQGDPAAALQDLDLFLSSVEQHSGPDIPNVWRAARDLTNVAGLLRAGAKTLQLSLRMQHDPGR
jgi:hypothetical protein